MSFREWIDDNEWVGASVLVGIVLLVATGAIRAGIMLFDRVPVVVMVGSVEVHRGMSYGVGVESSGDTTKVVILGDGYFSVFPRKYYVGKDITVTGVRP